MRLFSALCLCIFYAAVAHAAPNVFTSDVQMCSGRPWIDVTCNGADPTGAADSTTAISNTISTAVSKDWPIFFPAGTYKVTSKITVEFGGQANNGPQVISEGALIDGRTIASGNVLQVQCTGGTTASPVVCNHFQISGWLTVMGNGAGYAVVLGKTDFSDQQNAVRIEHLVVNNAGAGGAIQANYLTDGDLWLSGSTQGGSSSVAAVALEQVQTSKIGGYGSALGASAPALLIENGASVGNNFVGFGYDPNSNTCVSITSASATRNAWMAPYLPCTTATSTSSNATQNALIGPSFAGTNLGPSSTGIAVIGRGSLSRYSAPTVASKTLFGADDGTIFSAANALGAGTQFTAASLPMTLPDPAAVGAGWTAGFVSDANKAVVLTTSAGHILAHGMQLTTMTVAAVNSENFESAVLQSDGANFRVNYISQGAALINGLETTLPANWIFPGGPGYQTTIGDNGNVISSRNTTSGLAVTLPQRTTLDDGWTIDLVADGLPLTITVNGTGGGVLILSDVASFTTYPLAATSHYRVQFDGANFRLTRESSVTGCVNIMDAGGDPTNTNDNVGAFAIAAAKIIPGRACIYFPPGKYKFLSNVLYTYPSNIPSSITIRGDGSDVTELTWPNTSGGLGLTCTNSTNGLHVRGLTFSTGAVSGGTGLGISCLSQTSNEYLNPFSDLADVVFRGADGYAGTDYWTTCVSLTSASNFDIQMACQGAGGSSYAGPTNNSIGLFIGGAVGKISIVTNVRGQFNYTSVGISIGGYAQGVVVEPGSNFTGCYSGVNILPGITGIGQLNITNSQFNCASTALVDASGMQFVNFNHNLVFEPTTTSFGVFFSQYCYSNVFANTFLAIVPGQGTGIQYGTPSAVLCPGGSTNLVDDNTFISLGIGFELQSTASMPVTYGHGNINIGNVTNVLNNFAGTLAGSFAQILGVPYAQAVISGAVADGTDVRLTVNNSANFVSGQYVLSQGTCPTGIFQIKVIDGQHIDLLASTFTATCTGTLTTLP